MNQTLNKVYRLELNLLLNREKQLVEALPKMIALATDEELMEALAKHHKETKYQRDRLENILEVRTDTTYNEPCGTMELLLVEAEQISQSVSGDDSVRDSVIISGAQKGGHFEQAGYETVIGWAKALDLEADASLLQATLDEEEETANKLVSLAEGGLISEGINGKAAE